MYVSLPILLLVGAAVVLWLRNPIQRAQRVSGVGWIREVNVLGFFFNVESLSNRYNKLDHEEAALRRKLKKVVKDKEDERKALDLRVKNLNAEYKAHLRDWSGKRNWKYWFSIVPIPSFAFVEELEKGVVKPAPSTKSCYSLAELPASITKDFVPGTNTIMYVPRPKPPQQNKGKGNNNQQQSNNQQKSNNQ